MFVKRSQCDPFMTPNNVYRLLHRRAIRAEPCAHQGAGYDP